MRLDRIINSPGGGWTERSEGSPGVSGYHPPTPATPELEIDAPPSAVTTDKALDVRADGQVRALPSLVVRTSRLLFVAHETPAP